MSLRYLRLPLPLLISARDRPTLISLNRFEKKKNIALAVESYALLRKQAQNIGPIRLVLAGESLVGDGVSN